MHRTLKVCVILGDTTCADTQGAVWLLRRRDVDQIPVQALGNVDFGQVLCRFGGLVGKVAQMKGMSELSASILAKKWALCAA